MAAGIPASTTDDVVVSCGRTLRISLLFGLVITVPVGAVFPHIAAHDLGADDRETFMRVTLPLSLSGVVSGITLVFLPAVSSFFIPKFLGGGQYVLIGNLIEDYFVSTGDWNFGAAISMIMALIILGSMYITRKLDKQIGEEED